MKALGIKLSEVSKKHRLIVVPGGGEFADVVRNMDEKFSLSCNISHQMAIIGMDQYGLLLSDLIPNSIVVRKFKDLKYFPGFLSIFLPSETIIKKNPLENSWNVTSDSIALYIASQLHSNRVFLITDVDGIYTSDPKNNSNAELFQNLSAIELLSKNSTTSVDLYLPKLLLEKSIDCFIINGLFPERIEAILEGRYAISTLIKG